MGVKLFFAILALVLLGVLVAQELNNNKRKTELQSAEKKAKEIPTGCEEVFVFDGHGNSTRRIECKKSEK
jgi:hypothetical protein